MPRCPPVFNPYFDGLTTIAELVKPQVRPGARVTVLCYFLSDTPRDPYKGYVGFQYESDQKLEKVTHTPGIPMDSLLDSEKFQPIADWVVTQIRGLFPLWFH